MDFSIPADIQALLDECDAFIDDVIVPIEAEDDNIRFFDHRREDARTDWDRDGLPNAEWEALLGRMRREADTAGLLRYQLPARFGGRDGSNLAMAIVREHLARRGLGLHNDLQADYEETQRLRTPSTLPGCRHLLVLKGRPLAADDAHEGSSYPSAAEPQGLLLGSALVPLSPLLCSRTALRCSALVPLSAALLRPDSAAPSLQLVERHPASRAGIF